MEIILLILGLIAIGMLGILLRKLFSLEKIMAERNPVDEYSEELSKQLDKLQKEMDNEIKESRQETIKYITDNFRNLADILSGSQKRIADIQDKRLLDLDRQLTQKHDTLQKTVNDMLKHINDTMENRLLSIQRDNEKKLEQMRETVDEKLQKTLEDRISQSFKMVSERLEQVYKGLGEMQTLASGVGDLKKVLSNVKTRGILGEIQLGAILEQILSPDQYEENITTKKGSSERVEFAIKLPGDDEGVVYLPIDAKFPADAYSKLVDAYETGEVSQIDAAATHLERMIKTFAKDIKEKYISPPHTTDFGIMFLPFEGLYAEVVRRGMVETLQKDYKINIAGPSTMAALLNSLQMGFRTLAIQKHSSQVWDVLGAVKTEFDKFGNVLDATQKRINQANEELDKLVGVRTRTIQRKLRTVTALPEENSQAIIGYEDGADDFTDEGNEE
ncbi:MAG: DNA recombination protein RmuC [Anaerovoracaceae bacterium]